jgi:hypothetical protein
METRNPVKLAQKNLTDLTVHKSVDREEVEYLRTFVPNEDGTVISAHELACAVINDPSFRKPTPVA